MSSDALSGKTSPLDIAVLISGGGTTLHNLLQKKVAGQLNATIQLVVSSNAQAPGLRFATDASIPTLVVEKKDHPTPESFSAAIFDACRSANVRLVVMGGFLQHVLIPGDFVNRVTNIHPALIPAFCGKGYYGSRVHQAVLDYGAKVSGCTVHFVDDHYDHGPIILQRIVEVISGDTPKSLAERVFREECVAYPDAINLIADGRVRVDGRRVMIQTAE